MWELDADHCAKFRVSDWMLDVVTRGDGLELSASSSHGASLGGQIQLAGLLLPPVTESYVRGDELHLIMPQTDGCDVGIELALTVIRADFHLFVLETVISLQTQWLDLYPRVELSTGLKNSASNRWQMTPSGSSRWYDPSQKIANEHSRFAVLVDPRDRFSIDESQAGDQRLSFFGDFMEKGVIRKVQPWWVWSIEEIVPIVRQQLAKELSARPLPLAT